MCAEKLVGKWKLVDSQNFDEFMKEIGVSWTTRKIASTLKPNVIIKFDDLKWTIRTESSFKTTEITFELGKRFKQTTPDGREVDTTIVLKDNVLFEEQYSNEKLVTTVERYVNEKDEMILKCMAGSVVSVRTYVRA